MLPPEVWGHIELMRIRISLVILVWRTERAMVFKHVLLSGTAWERHDVSLLQNAFKTGHSAMKWLKLGRF